MTCESLEQHLNIFKDLRTNVHKLYTNLVRNKRVCKFGQRTVPTENTLFRAYLLQRGRLILQKTSMSIFLIHRLSFYTVQNPNYRFKTRMKWNSAGKLDCRITKNNSRRLLFSISNQWTLFSIAKIDFQIKYRSLIDCNGHRKGSDWMFNVHLDSAGMGSFQFTPI